LPRWIDPEKAKGNLPPGELAEYAAPIVAIHPFYPYSADELIEAHRARNASRVAPPVRPGPFRHRTIRRFA
jgi:hypothetical protein